MTESYFSVRYSPYLTLVVGRKWAKTPFTKEQEENLLGSQWKRLKVNVRKKRRVAEHWGSSVRIQVWLHGT